MTARQFMFFVGLVMFGSGVGLSLTVDFVIGSILGIPGLLMAILASQGETP